jgi:hypothetical protein
MRIDFIETSSDYGHGGSGASVPLPHGMVRWALSVVKDRLPGYELRICAG